MDELQDHLHELARLAHARGSRSADDVPFEKKRIGDAQARLNGETAGWIAQLRSIQHDMQEELEASLTPEQRDSPKPTSDRATLDTIDRVMKYGIMAVGVCLILGLFARLASLAGALFLGSIVLSQPPWLATRPRPIRNCWKCWSC